MSNLDKRREDILRYISDEMESSEREQFEIRLSNDSELQEEVLAFQETQGTLKLWENTDFEIPSAIDLLEENTQQAKIRKLPALKRWMSYAAAAAGLLFFAWISDLQFTQKGNAFTFHFGPLANQEPVGEDRISEIVEIALSKYEQNSEQDQQNVNQDKIDSQIEHMETNLTAKLAALYRTELNEIKKNQSIHERKQLAAIEELVQGMQFEQRLVLQETIVAVLDQLEQQRLEDRIEVESAFQRVNELFANIQLNTANGGTESADVKLVHY